MIRGRLVAVNGQAVKPPVYTDDRAQRLVDREFNLSHDAPAAQHNQLAAAAGRRRGRRAVGRGRAGARWA